MSHSELSAIATFCAAHDLPWDEGRAARMTQYLDLLLQFNEAMNLIGPLSRKEVIEELLLDSVVAAAARRPAGPMLDVGSGAGLPGFPLKILFPQLPITLVEPRQKRSTFLKLVSHRLGLEEVSVERCRIEDFPGANFDFVISKAFEAPTRWLKTARPRLSEGGAVVCMARRHDQDELLDRASSLELSLVGEATVATPPPTAEDRVCYAFQ